MSIQEILVVGFFFVFIFGFVLRGFANHTLRHEEIRKDIKKIKEQLTTLDLHVNGVSGLREKLEHLTIGVSNIPTLDVCLECNTARPQDYFISPTCCLDCEPVVKKREKAIELAEANPEKVIKCCKK